MVGFHPDHLGSTLYITTRNGSISQFVAYLPFGEVLFEEHSSSFSSPNLFNGKELDRETGLSYYGARYYDNKYNIWYGLDPKMEKYPNVGGYVFCINNPIVFKDPDGRDIVYFDKNGIELTDKREKSTTVFKTYVADTYWNDTFIQAKMPGKITYSLDKNVDPSSDKYNKYDYEIAAATHIINEGIKEGVLSVGEGYKTGKNATELDVNLVKAIAYKESRLGQGVSISTNASDIFSMFNMGDYGDKGKMGMTKENVKNGKGAAQSTSWGAKWLYYKAFKSEDGKTKDFQSWEYAVQKFGPGAKEKTYKETVFKINNSIKDEN